ncbi:hypothetical protein H9P43_007698 [Blastocladiella emersonii ATCC 22665]|nr:hypothetical protein H9P43_007698 [Blastocladiella emersonii ATCC 22665]
MSSYSPVHHSSSSSSSAALPPLSPPPRSMPAASAAGSVDAQLAAHYAQFDSLVLSHAMMHSCSVHDAAPAFASDPRPPAPATPSAAVDPHRRDPNLVAVVDTDLLAALADTRAAVLAASVVTESGALRVVASERKRPPALPRPVAGDRVRPALSWSRPAPGSAAVVIDQHALPTPEPSPLVHSPSSAASPRYNAALRPPPPLPQHAPVVAPSGLFGALASPLVSPSALASAAASVRGGRTRAISAPAPYQPELGAPIVHERPMTADAADVGPLSPRKRRRSSMDEPDLGPQRRPAFKRRHALPDIRVPLHLQRELAALAPIPGSPL